MRNRLADLADMNSVNVVASRELRTAMTTLDRQEPTRTIKILYLLDALSSDEGSEATMNSSNLVAAKCRT